MKYAELKIFCICVDVYNIYESSDYDRMYEVISTLKNEKIKIKSILTEKYEDMLENPDFEQVYWSRTAMGIYRNEHDSVRLTNSLAYYDRSYYENNNYSDLKGTILKSLNEIFWWSILRRSKRSSISYSSD